jgi:ribonuclease-3
MASPRKSRPSLEESRVRFRAQLMERIGDGELPRFGEALTHSSWANETRGERDARVDNQRLEFLGDAVLGLCVSERLVHDHPAADEGALTRMRSALVNASALAAWAREVEIGPCLLLGRGANAAGEREQPNVLADAVEALVAAVYDARGPAGARALVAWIVETREREGAGLGGLDPKSALQEQVQAERLPSPSYRVTGTRGPQHDLAFEVEVSIGDRPLARGTSRSKRLAERAAAEAGLVAFAEVGPEPFAGQSVRPRAVDPDDAGEPAKTSDPIR